MSTDPAEQPKKINSASAKKIVARRKIPIDPEHLATQVINGNKTALSRAITLLESRSKKHLASAQQILNHCLNYSGKSVRIGITGVPGVGKSTFIEALGDFLTKKGKKTAVLAIDPTSSQSHGSILGDKTRMQSLSVNPLAFIRPSASSGSLGGVAQHTREAIMLCEAAGYEIIIVETVGVGQSETAVHSMTDFFLLLKLAGAGDELQGIKRGIIEMADAIVINKADGENKNAAQQAKKDFAKALHLYPPKTSNWQPPVMTSSSINNEGIRAIWEQVEGYLKLTQDNGYFNQNRKNQNTYWLHQTIEDAIKNDFYENPKVKEKLPEYLKQINDKKSTPFQAAGKLLNLKK